MMLLLFGLLFGKLLSSHMLYPKSDGLYSAGSTWGDLAWHLSLISSASQRGFSVLRDDPIFPGEKLSYPFVPDVLTAMLLRNGSSLRMSLIVPALLGLLGAVAGIYVLARKVTGTTFGAVATLLLFFFNGSIAGCYYLWQDLHHYHSGVQLFFENLPKDYAHVPEHNLVFSNLINDYLLPQRASIFGLFVGVLAVLWLWHYWQHATRRALLIAGLLISCLPLVHVHTFIALIMAAILLFCIQLISSSRQREVMISWCWFAVPIATIALPQMLWIIPRHSHTFLRVQLGWMAGNDPILLFWLKNLGFHLFVFLGAFFVARRELKTFCLAFAGIFLISNVLVFQPYDYDNLKIMVWWFLVSCLLAAYLLQRLRFRLGTGVALFLLTGLTVTGIISVYREMNLSWRLFSSDDLALAEFVKDHTSREALFLTSDKHNNPISCLAGRRIVMGYRGWLWTHGIDYRRRERDVLAMFSGRDDASSLLQMYGVNFVLFERDRAAELGENRKFLAEHLIEVYASKNYTLFAVPGLDRSTIRPPLPSNRDSFANYTSVQARLQSTASGGAGQVPVAIPRR